MTDIDPSDSREIVGSELLKGPINVGGELNVSGELNIDTDAGIFGTVTDASGAPVEGALLKLFLQDNGFALETTTTDANGEYEFLRHVDATGSEQTWHVVASYEEGGDEFFAKSQFGVQSALGGFNVDATGGTTVTTITDANGDRYRVHAFENVGSDTLTVTEAFGGSTIDVLVVAGGGGGGNGTNGLGQQNHTGGGAGAGGLIYRPDLPVLEQTYNIQVGDGGTPNAQGENSSFGSLIAIGGGNGGSSGWFGVEEPIETTRAGDGGSGGGQGNPFEQFKGEGVQPDQPGDSGAFGFGSDGVFGTNDNSIGTSGGGGAGGSPPGGDGDTTGGPGLDLSDEFGTAFGDAGVFASGGAGTGAQARPGGGADGTPIGQFTQPDPAQANTGGGGGGAYTDAYQGFVPGGLGGSGVVLVRYRI